MKHVIGCVALSLWFVATGCSFQVVHPVGDAGTPDASIVVVTDAGFTCVSDWQCKMSEICAAGACVNSCTNLIAFSASPTTTLPGIPTDGGNPTFAPKYSHRIAVDVNGDSSLDVVGTASPSDGTVSLFLGKGDGSFQAEQIFAGPQGERKSVQVLDFNQDSSLDVLISTPTSVTLQRLSQSGGNWSLSAPSQLLASGLTELRVEHMVGSPLPDVVGLSVDGKFLRIFEQTSAGVLNQVKEVAFAGSAASLVTGDVDADGRVDVLVSFKAPEDRVELYRNTSTGFVLNGSWSTPANPDFLRLTDLNGDGKSDLLFGSRGTTSLATMLNNGQGGFEAAKKETGLTTVHGLFVADINRDSRPDALVVTHAVASFPGAPGLGSLSLYAMLGDGQGLSTQPTPLSAIIPLQFMASDAEGMVLADFSRDGNLDVLANFLAGGNSYVAGACR